MAPESFTPEDGKENKQYNYIYQFNYKSKGVCVAPEIRSPMPESQRTHSEYHWRIAQ